MMSAATQQRISELVQSDRVVLFMKGERRMPQCGFSAAVVEILDQLIPQYTTVNVLKDPDIRDGIKIYSEWPTIPQLYIDGEFLGGCDIVKEMYAKGELQTKLGAKEEPLLVPKVELTASAAQAIQQALADNNEGEEGEELRLEISSRFEHGLALSHKQPGDVEIEMHGVKLLIDRASAKRAEGVRIDYVQEGERAGFKIENPNAPQVKNITVKEVKAKLDAGEDFVFVDVRPQSERDIAKIAQARMLDDEVKEFLNGLDRDAMVVFHCKGGGRSQKAAEHYAALGYRNVYNMLGGINAWANEVDPSIAKY